MIETPTCLVLGAGASAPYGFPVGADLRNEIIGSVATPNNRVWNELTKSGYRREELSEFVAALNSSMLTSVDAFLAHRSEYSRVGKACLAATLLIKENHGWLTQPPGSDDHWYQHLWQRLQLGGSKTFGDNRLSVVTFNYDRSLEWFLTLAYANSFGRPLEEAWSVINATISLVHVHGDLGPFPYPAATDDTRPYEPTLTSMSIAAAARRLIVLSEAQDDSPEFQRARNLIEASDQTLFLGCAYHPENMSRLGCIPGGGPNWIGTGFGLTTRLRERTKHLWNISVGDPSWRSLSFLRESVDLD